MATKSRGSDALTVKIANITIMTCNHYSSSDVMPSLRWLQCLRQRFCSTEVCLMYTRLSSLQVYTPEMTPEAMSCDACLLQPDDAAVRLLPNASLGLTILDTSLSGKHPHVARMIPIWAGIVPARHRLIHMQTFWSLRPRSVSMSTPRWTVLHPRSTATTDQSALQK
jgi:hypothetical protein